MSRDAEIIQPNIKISQGWPVSLDDHQCCHSGLYVPHSMLAGLGGCAETIEQQAAF